MEPGLLLIPGPVPLPLRVLEELSKPAMPHYGDAWVKAHGETREMLRYLWSSGDAHVLPIAGPGHAGLEALAYTFLRPGDRVVVVSNGFFGERTREVLHSHRVKTDVVSSDWAPARTSRHCGRPSTRPRGPSRSCTTRPRPASRIPWSRSLRSRTP